MRLLHVVRHGRTATNAAGRLLGHADPGLDTEGEAQAAAVAAALAASSRPVARVITSPLLRCRSTAGAIAVAVGAEVVADERWVELDYGELEGVPLGDLPEETWAEWRADVHWRPPGGETLFELGERVRGACRELAGGGDDEGDVVVVSHVSPVKAAVAWALGVGDDVTWRLFVAPGSLSRIAVRSGVPSLVAFNVTTFGDRGP